MNAFSARLIADGTWTISGDGCDCYLLEGTREAMMIDAGESKEDIRLFAERLTSLPLNRVINTHSHFDHTGGNGYFNEVLCTESAAKSVKNTMGADPADYPLRYTCTPVCDGDVLDLGKRRLQIIELNCHSPGSIVILDLDRRLLFSGDEIESGQVLLLPGYAERRGQIHAKAASFVETCLCAMKRVKILESQFDAICPAHNGGPIHKSYVDRFIRLCEGILDGSISGNSKLSSPSYDKQAAHYPFPDAGYLRAENEGAALVYNGYFLFERDHLNSEAKNPATPLHLIASHSLYEL